MTLRKLVSIATSLLLTLGFVGAAKAATPGLTPTFGTPEATAGGFAVKITNYDANYTWLAAPTDCGVATVSSDGWLEVTGLDPSTTVTVTVKTSRSGYDDATATISSTSSEFFSSGELLPGLRGNSGDGYAADDSGNLYFASVQGGQARLSKSTDAGLTWSLVNSIAFENSTNFPSVRVTTGSNGRVAMVWQDGTNATTQIKASVSLDSGATWSTPTVLDSGMSSQWVRIGFAGTDSLVAAWYFYNGTTFVVEGSVSNDFGATWSSTVSISDPTASGDSHDIVETRDGNLVVYYKVSSGVAFRQFDGATQTWGSVVPENFPAGVYQMDAAALPGQGVILVLSNAYASSSQKIQAAYFDGTSVFSGDVTPTNGDNKYPKVAVTDTTVMVGWASDVNDLALVTSAVGSPLTFGSPTVLRTGARNIEHINMVGLDQSSAAITYVRNLVSGEPYALEAIVTQDDGGTWGSVQGISSTAIRNYTPIPMATSDGEFSLVWRVQSAVPEVYLKTASWSPSITLPTKELYLAAEMEAGATGSSLYSAVTYNGKLYYSASTSATGRELFSFDGTNVELVEDLNPGSADGLYSSGGVIGVFNNKLFLKGDDGTTGLELYAYDGTSVELVADVISGPTGSSPTPDNLVYYNNLLFFQGQAQDASEARGYVYDFATEQFQDMQDQFAGYTKRYFFDPIIFQGSLYFRAGEPGQGTKLVKYDGTTFSEVNITATSFFNFVHFGDLIVGAGSGSNGVELWAFDGTTAFEVADLNPGSADAYPSKGVVLGGRYYFTARTPDATSGVTDNELYSWDGLTAPVKEYDFVPNNATTTFDDWGWPGPYVAGSDGSLYFSANDAANGKEFRAFNPCDAAPTLPLDLVTGTGGSGNPQAIGELDGTVYVGLSGSSTGTELYAYGVKPAGFTASVFTPTYTISYDANGGTGTTTSSHAGGSVTLSSGTGFAMSGKVLLGWDTSSTATTATYPPSASYTLSANVTLYAIWGDPSSTPTINPNLPTLDLPTGGGIPTAPSGGDLELTGKNLGGVKEAEVDTKKATIKEQGPTNLTLGLPELDPGIYDLSLTGDQGKLTIQGAVRVISGFASVTPDAQALIAAWTKVNEDRTEVRMYAKDPVAVGKVQFKVNGREIAWVRAVDEADPKLLQHSSGASYLVRRVELKPGKNRFEILVDGDRIWRATYVPRS